MPVLVPTSVLTPAAAVPLATVADLEARLGRTFTAEETTRAGLLLDDVSATVRAYTGQQFTAATSTVRLRARGGRIRLPQRPATAITTVKNTDGVTVAHTWHSGDVVTLTDYPASGWFDVTYNHGYVLIPADIIAVACQIAGRAFGTTADNAGYQSESIGTYSYTVGVAAAAGATGLLNDEKAVLDRYRRVGGMAYIGP